MYVEGVCEGCAVEVMVFPIHPDASEDGKEHIVCDECAPTFLKREYRDS